MTPPHSGARNAVQDMKPIDAVEYLLGIVEGGTWVTDGVHHDIDEWGVDLTGTMRRILIALYDKGSLVSHGALYDAVYFDRADADDLPDLKIITVYISKMRPRLPKHVSIETVWGRGFRLEVAS